MKLHTKFSLLLISLLIPFFSIARNKTDISSLISFENTASHGFLAKNTRNFSLVQQKESFNQVSKVTLHGQVVDKQTDEGVELATIQLLSLPDSTFIKGVTSGAEGHFTFSSLSPNNYVLRISYIGYKPLIHSVQRDNLKKNTQLGKLALVTDAILLDVAEITAEAPAVTVVQDTLVFNTSAYRVSKNAMLEELVAKLPGAQIDEEGKITINGQEISKIMVDGKEFFVKDPDIAMKNLPVDIIENVKSYNKKSDQARITGIDDGNDETVLDLTVKKGMNKGWFGNADVGFGNHDRYTVKGMVNHFSDGDQLTGLWNFNNVRDASVGNRRRRFRNNGIQEDKSGGINFNFERKKIETGGNINYNDTETDVQSQSTSETFLDDLSSFSKGSSNRINRNKSLGGDFKLEWKPDSLTNLLIYPWFNYSRTSSSSFGESRTGDIDDFDHWEDMINNGQAINKQTTKSYSSGNSLGFGSIVLFHRKLNEKGRNIALEMNYSYNTRDNDGGDYSLIEYYKKGTESKRDLLTKNDNNSYSFKTRMTYSEPVFTNRFLQFAYGYEKSYNKTDRRTYDILDFDETSDLEELLVSDLSKLARNYYDNHELSIGLNTIREKYRFNIGFKVQPQRNKLEYHQGDNLVDTTRTVVNYSPTVDLKYQFHKQSFLRLMYRGSTNQPDMLDLLPIQDITNPLNVRIGNPGLKPSFSNFFMVFYNNYFSESQRSISLHGFFRNTINAVSSKVTYDKETGGKTTQPENINGNWNARAMFLFTTPLKNKKFTLSSHSRTAYNNIVGYLSTSQDSEVSKNKTKNLRLSESLNFNYRNDWFESGLEGSIFYSKTHNTLQPQTNRETFDYTIGLNTNIKLPWDLNFSTDGTYAIKKGYSQGLDRNEFIWNLQVSKDFLKNRNATISLQLFDILKQSSNLSRSISASMRQDIEYNEITNFFMVHFVYKLNTLGGEKKNTDNRRRGHGRGPGHRGRGGF